MSFIYDALQKTQRNCKLINTQNTLIQKNLYSYSKKTLFYSLSLLVLCACAGAIFAYLLRPENIINHQGKLKPEPQHHRAVETPKPQPANLWVTANEPKPEVIKAQTALEANPIVTAPVLAQATPAPKSISVQVKALLPDLKLNGVLISGFEKIALINNRTFRLGDLIDGMKIVEIELTQVKLQRGEEIVELKV